MMTPDQSLLAYFLNASPVVRAVMLMLIIASIISWTMIFQRSFFLKKAREAMAVFEELFWSGNDLGKLYTDLSAEKRDVFGMESIFQAGFREFVRLRKQVR